MTNKLFKTPRRYAEYPVVGVNWIQAINLPKWRTDRVNEVMLEREVIYPKMQNTKQQLEKVQGTFSSWSLLK